MKTTQFTVIGLSCQRCVEKVKNAINSIEGVEAVDVNSDFSHATVTWKSIPDTGAVIDAVEKLGYQIRPSSRHAPMQFTNSQEYPT